MFYILYASVLFVSILNGCYRIAESINWLFGSIIGLLLFLTCIPHNAFFLIAVIGLMFFLLGLVTFVWMFCVDIQYGNPLFVRRK